MDASSIHVGKDLKDLIHWTHNTDDRMIHFPVRARSSSPTNVLSASEDSQLCSTLLLRLMHSVVLCGPSGLKT